MTRWEYLAVQQTFELRQSDGERRQVWHLVIRRPRENDIERHVSSDSHEPERVTKRIGDLLDELGEQGWELVAEYSRGAAVGPNLGWDTSSWPIEIGYRFKRPIVE
jgi:hypothetical protein